MTNLSEKHNRVSGRIGRILATPLLGLLLLAGTGSASAATLVKFGAPPWPGVTVKTTVARQILGAIGYKTSITNASWIINLQSVARGDLDADLGIWMPTQKSSVEPLVKAGKVDLLVANVPDAKYDVVVPNYVWKAGVHCICDLNKYAARFGRKIYGIEAGNDGNTIMKNAIKNDTYHLAGWKVVPSSTAGMLSEAGRAISQHKWIVFLGWKPHWMNIKYHIRYLRDPKKIWGGQSSVHTAANPAFVKRHPNVARFLRQMVVPSRIQSRWIYQYGYQQKPAKAVARHWIGTHMKRVAHWLRGVRTADGKQSAIAAVKAKFSA